MMKVGHNAILDTVDFSRTLRKGFSSCLHTLAKGEFIQFPNQKIHFPIRPDALFPSS